MDQEKFDQHLMDYLFDELDEVTAAAMKRKIESDADCRDLEAGLRATIELTQRMPFEEPDDELEARILTAANLAQQDEPWPPKLLRSLSWAGSHAMRPQLAMAAVLMLVLGSSILLLRARPGSVAVTPIKENGHAAQSAPAGADAPVLATAEPLAVAELDPELTKARPAKNAASAAAEASAHTGAEDETLEVAELDEQYQRAMGNYRSGNFAEAQRDFAVVNQSKSAKAPSASLYEARAVRAQSGCQTAVSYYGNVRSRFGGSAAAADAIFEEADCQRQLGQAEVAKQLLLSLSSNKEYAARVEAELNNSGQAATSGGQAVASQRRAAKAARPAPPAVQAKPPAGGSGGKGKTAAPDAFQADEAALY